MFLTNPRLGLHHSCWRIVYWRLSPRSEREKTRFEDSNGTEILWWSIYIETKIRLLKGKHQQINDSSNVSRSSGNLSLLCLLTEWLVPTWTHRDEIIKFWVHPPVFPKGCEESAVHTFRFFNFLRRRASRANSFHSSSSTAARLRFFCSTLSFFFSFFRFFCAFFSDHASFFFIGPAFAFEVGQTPVSRYIANFSCLIFSRSLSLKMYGNNTI